MIHIKNIYTGHIVVDNSNCSTFHCQEKLTTYRTQMDKINRLNTEKGEFLNSHVCFSLGLLIFPEIACCLNYAVIREDGRRETRKGKESRGIAEEHRE